MLEKTFIGNVRTYNYPCCSVSEPKEKQLSRQYIVALVYNFRHALQLKLHFFNKKIICQEGLKHESTNSDVEGNACIFCMPCAVHALRRPHTLGKDGAFAGVECCERSTLEGRVVSISRRL